MKAYAILDGGGVKGAALGGCLDAAETHKIEFAGYGGTSAGAIVAALAAVGYTPDELRDVLLNELRLADFIKDGEKDVAALKDLMADFGWMKLASKRGSLRRLFHSFGLCSGDPIQVFIRKKIVQKIPALDTKRDITFDDLETTHKRPPLRIVGSNLGTHEPHIFKGGESVLDAVQASASYPFVFKPVVVAKHHVVDGGLCTNLPLFLFQEERRANGLPIIAFDLVLPYAERPSPYKFKNFCVDMLDTALESGDYFQQTYVGGVYRVQVRVPAGIDTLDFDLTRAQVDALWNAGKAEALEYFACTMPQWVQAETNVERLQASVGVPASLVTPVLRAFTDAFQRETRGRDLRANVMLPTPRGTRMIVYQYGMDRDPDVDMELALDSGCSGRAWTQRLPVAADLIEAKVVFETKWRMTQAQQNKVRTDRAAMLSLPLFDLSAQHSTSAQTVADLPLLGTLSVDSATRLADTGWVGDSGPAVVALGTTWADIVARLLT